ncbi:MAG: xanthine dehydrogenase accessory protein XdhC [Methylobacteriaceae bacterium]|nr:xanthine dehydrogenase accessory protein XdhC [Methylobacteriaceae bacterium]
MSGDDLADWLAARLAADEPTMLARVARAEGSTPRDDDAAMLVTARQAAGTIGGGALEWSAIERARELLAGADAAPDWDVPLGPALGQCCGGRVTVRFVRAEAATVAALRDEAARRAAARPVAFLFGAGHVGRALMRALVPLPIAATLIDSRQTELALAEGPRLLRERPELAVAEAPPGAAVVALTHSHTLDFLIARAALERGDLAYVGMIGSATKRALFVRWLAAAGADPALAAALVLPIGGAAPRDKRPEVIAAMTAAELCLRLLRSA